MNIYDAIVTFLNESGLKASSEHLHHSRHLFQYDLQRSLKLIHVLSAACNSEKVAAIKSDDSDVDIDMILPHDAYSALKRRKGNDDDDDDDVNVDKRGKKRVRNCVSQTKIKQFLDPQLVLMCSSKDDIDASINAFINRKQDEVGRSNQIEFCTSAVEAGESCARIAAVSLRQEVRLRCLRVDNGIGGLSAASMAADVAARTTNASKVKTDVMSNLSDDNAASLDNRLGTLERILDVSVEQRQDVFNRLARLEKALAATVDKVQQQQQQQPHKNQSINSTSNGTVTKYIENNATEMKSEEVDLRIQKLQAILLNRSKEDPMNEYPACEH